jgi:hypothetical protein
LSSLPDDLAALDDGVVVGQFNQLFHILVDDQHALAFAPQAGQAGPDFIADQRRQALGGFVEDEQARVGDQARPMASICCSPPES